MPPSKSRKKKGGHRRKRKAGSKLQSSSVRPEDGDSGPAVDPAEEARLLALARAEAKSLAELRRHWSKKMKHYVKFVALGRGANDDQVRARRSSYQRVSSAVGGDAPKSRKLSLVAAMNPSSYPLAFKLLTPRDDRQITSLVVKVDDTMGMREVERLLEPHVKDYEEAGNVGTEASSSPTTSPPGSPRGSTAALAATPETAASGASAAVGFKFSFFYAPPGSLSRRRLETPTDWAWALKDFHKRRSSTAVATVEDYSQHLLHDVVSSDLDSSSPKTLLRIQQLWEFSTYTEAHMYITSEEIHRLCGYLRQSRRLAARSAAAGALWSVAYNTHLRSLVHDSADIIRTLADPAFLSSFNAFADSDRDSTRTHVHVLGLMAALMADGSLGAQDILGVGGTAFLGTYLKHAGGSTPRGSRLAAQALYDSCLLSVKAQERIGRTCNPSTAVMAAAEHAASEAALDPENAAALVALGEVEKTLAPVNVVHSVVRGLTHIKDGKTFAFLLRICVLFSRSPSELLREALAVTTSTAGVSVVGTLLSVLGELRDEAEAQKRQRRERSEGIAGGPSGKSGTSSSSSSFKNQRSSERGKQLEERRFAMLSAEDRDSLILHVLSTLWGVLESASRSEHVLRRGSGSVSRGALPGVGKSALDTCVDLIAYARKLTHRRNREDRQKLVTKQIAYCAVSAAACLVPMVLDEALQEDAGSGTAAAATAKASPATAPTMTSMSVFQDLCALFDEARDFAHEAPPEKHSRSTFESSSEANGRGWASVRQRAASAMALLASSSAALTQDLVQAGFFARLITQVEEEQAYEQEVRTRKGVGVRAAAAAAKARAERRARSIRHASASSAADGSAHEPTACEWLLRALAALAKVPKSQPLPASLVERCCALLQDPMWLALLEQKKKKQKRKADRDHRFSGASRSKKNKGKPKKDSGSSGGGGGAYFAPPKKSKMTIREKAEAEAKAKADAAERKRLEAMEGPADMIGNVPMDEIVATVRHVSDGLDSVLLLLWRLARQSKHHRMAMLLDATLVELLRDAAEAALALDAMAVVESVLATLHMCVVDILDEEDEAVPNSEFPPGVTKIQSLGVGAFKGWVGFLLRLIKDCCGVGDLCYADVSRLLVRVRRGGGAGGGFGLSKKVTRPLSEEGTLSSNGRPAFGGRKNRVASRFGLPAVVAPDKLHAPARPRGNEGQDEPSSWSSTADRSTTAADPHCNVWTLAATVLWMLSLSKTLGYQMIDAGLPRMLVRIACERGERLTPLLRIRAAGAAQFMSMRPEYRRAFQIVTESERSRKRKLKRTASASAAAAAATSSPSAAALPDAAERGSGEFGGQKGGVSPGGEAGEAAAASLELHTFGLGAGPAPRGTSEAVARAEWDRALQRQLLEAQALQQQQARAKKLLSPPGSKSKKAATLDTKSSMRAGGMPRSKDSAVKSSEDEAAPTAQFSEILAVTLLHMSDYDMRCYGTTCIARQSVMHDSRKKSIVMLGGIDLLVSQLDQASNQSIFTEFATQALLNLSSYPPNQEYICVCCQGIALKRLLNMVRDPLRPASASFAAAVLSNVAHHPGNRTRLYKAELATGARDTFGPVQSKPIDRKDVASYQGVGGRLLTLRELNAGADSAKSAAGAGAATPEGGGGGGGVEGGPGDGFVVAGGGSDPANPKARRKMVRSRFDAWFAHEVEGDMTEAQLESIRKLEGDAVSAATSKRTHKAHRPRSPRLVSEHVRQLHLRAAPVPHKMVADAAKRNLQSSLCQPLSTLWHGKTPILGDAEPPTLSKRSMASVKQLAMAASVRAGPSLSTTPGLTTSTIAKQDMLVSARQQMHQRQQQQRTDAGGKTAAALPDFDPTWMDPESRSVLRWTPLVHKIERARPKASDSLTLDKVRSGRRAEMYATAPPDMTVFLEPRQSPRNQVQFKEGGILTSSTSAGSGGGKNHGPRLAVWTHIDGSKASIGLFPEYRLPGGGKVFFYEHQGLHEAVFPPEAPPMPPMDEEAYGAPVALRKSSAPCPDWQHDPPLLRSCPAPTPPPCPVGRPGGSGSALPADGSSAATEGGGAASSSATSLDAVLERLASTISPSFFIAHRAHLHVAETQFQREDAAQDDGWRLEDSIFAPRPFESDAAAFWDESWVEEAAFRVDWARAIRKQAFRNVLTGTHGYGHCAFAVKDEIEVHARAVDGSGQHWFQARVRRVVRGPSLDVEYLDGSREHYVSLARVRFPGGGKPGGFGGRCRRWRSPRKETKTMILQSESLPDIVGLNGAEIRRIRLQSGCRISVERNGDDAFAFKAEGVPENLQILEKILDDIDHISLVRCALAHNYPTALRAFNLFRSSGSGNAFALTSNEYDSFLAKCKIVEPRSGRGGNAGEAEAAHSKHTRALEHSLRNIFKAVNFEEKALNKEQAKLNEFNLDSAVMRFEWLELLTRVAKCKYHAEASGIDEAIEMLFHRNIEPYLGSMGQVDHDIFRDAALYQRPIDALLTRNRPMLIGLFAGYAGKLHRGGVSKRRAVLMSQPEYLEMFRHLRLITHQFSVVEAKFSYFAAKMLVIDDVNQPDRATMITFVEFLEAIVRACDIHAIPTEATIREAGFTSFDAYHDKVSKTGQTDEQAKMRRRADALHAKTANRHYLHRRHADPRPLHVRLALFLELIKARVPRKGHVRTQRRIAAWYADGKYETTRNRAHDSLKYVRGTTVKALHDSVPAPKLVWVGRRSVGGEGGGAGEGNDGEKKKKKKKKRKRNKHHQHPPQGQPPAGVTVLVAKDTPMEETHLRREKKNVGPEERILNAEVEKGIAEQGKVREE